MKTLRILAATLVALSAAACGSGSGPTAVPAASARDAARPIPGPASRNELPGDTSTITTARNPGIGSGAGFIQGDTVPPLPLPPTE